MTIRIKCPNCSRGVQATDEYAGKSAKCPGCGGKIDIPWPETIVDETLSESKIPPAPPDYDEIPLASALDEENSMASLLDEEIPLAEPPIATSPQVAKSLAFSRPGSPTPVESRYRNLRKYLDWTEQGIRILFKVINILLVIFASVLIVLSMIESEWLMAAAYLGIAILTALFIYIWYVFSLASIEFVNVVIDTEENTRRIEVNTRAT